MAVSQDSERDTRKAHEHPESEELFHNGNALAWEPMAYDLWVPYRIRGSWRGGDLG
jgi:hypothetical protein